jgi:pilus assembly protein Flp/PilA
MLELMKDIVKCQKGATAIEYGLIASLIVIAMMGALGSVGGTSSITWNKVSNKIVNSTQ